MTDSAENIIKKYANGIIEDFKTSKYKDKFVAIADYEKDCKNFSKLPQNFSFHTNTSNAHKELAERLLNGYDNLRADVKKQFKKEFFKNVEKRCPFCGQLLESSGKVASDVPTADLDHFFPKYEYPQFALLSKNLIPTCIECNRIEKHTKYITPEIFKSALSDLKLLEIFQEHPKSHFKIYSNLNISLDAKSIFQNESENVIKLTKLYGLEERYNNIISKSYKILLNIIHHSEICSPKSLENLLENIASSNWHEVNDGYSLNNSPQIWQEFIENILYDECKLMALWDEVKSSELKFL